MTDEPQSTEDDISAWDVLDSLDAAEAFRLGLSPSPPTTPDRSHTLSRRASGEVLVLPTGSLQGSYPTRRGSYNTIMAGIDKQVDVVRHEVQELERLDREYRGEGVESGTPGPSATTGADAAEPSDQQSKQPAADKRSIVMDRISIPRTYERSESKGYVITQQGGGLLVQQQQQQQQHGGQISGRPGSSGSVGLGRLSPQPQLPDEDPFSAEVLCGQSMPAPSPDSKPHKRRTTWYAGVRPVRQPYPTGGEKVIGEKFTLPRDELAGSVLLASPSSSIAAGGRSSMPGSAATTEVCPYDVTINGLVPTGSRNAAPLSMRRLAPQTRLEQQMSRKQGHGTGGALPEQLPGWMPSTAQLSFMTVREMTGNYRDEADVHSVSGATMDTMPVPEDDRLFRLSRKSQLHDARRPHPLRQLLPTVLADGAAAPTRESLDLLGPTKRGAAPIIPLAERVSATSNAQSLSIATSLGRRSGGGTGSVSNRATGREVLPTGSSTLSRNNNNNSSIHSSASSAASLRDAAQLADGMQLCTPALLPSFPVPASPSPPPHFHGRSGFDDEDEDGGGDGGDDLDGGGLAGGDSTISYKPSSSISLVSGLTADDSQIQAHALPVPYAHDTLAHAASAPSLGDPGHPSTGANTLPGAGAQASEGAGGIDAGKGGFAGSAAPTTSETGGRSKKGSTVTFQTEVSNTKQRGSGSGNGSGSTRSGTSFAQLSSVSPSTRMSVPWNKTPSLVAPPKRRPVGVDPSEDPLVTAAAESIQPDGTIVLPKRRPPSPASPTLPSASASAPASAMAATSASTASSARRATGTGELRMSQGLLPQPKLHSEGTVGAARTSSLANVTRRYYYAVKHPALTAGGGGS